MNELPPEVPGDVPPSDDLRAHAAKRVLLSTVSGMGNTVIVAALGALAIRIITVHVGPHSYGLFVAALTFVTTAMLLSDLGITSITGREIAKRPEDAAEILGHNLGLRLTISFAMIPLLIGLGVLIYRGTSGELVLTIVILTLAIPFDALRTTSLSYYVASIRTYYTAAVTLLQQVLYVAGVLIAIYTGHGIVGCAVSYLVATSVTAVVAIVVTRRELAFRPRFGAAQWRTAIRQSVSLGAIWVVNLLYLKADLLLLSRMVAPRQVGLYGVAYSFITFFSVIPALLGTSLLPLYARATTEELTALVRRASQFLGFIGVLLATGTLLFAPQAIRILSGPHFLGATTPLRILAIATIFTYFNAGLGYAAVAKNKHHRVIYVSVFGLVLNVVLNLIAIPRWGIVGSAYATLISEAVALAGVRYVYGRDVDRRVSLLSQSIKPLLVGGAIVAIAALAVEPSAPASLTLLLWAPLVVACYVGGLAALRGLPEDAVRLLERLGAPFSRRLRRAGTGGSSS